MGHAIPVRTDYTAGEGSPACPASERCCADATAVSDCGRARRSLAGRGGEDRWHGSSDAAGLGDPVQRARTLTLLSFSIKPDGMAPRPLR